MRKLLDHKAKTTMKNDNFGDSFNPADFITNFLIDYPAGKPEEFGDATLHNTIARQGFDILKNLSADLPPQIGMVVADKATKQKEAISFVQDEGDLQRIWNLLTIEFTTVLGMTEPPKKQGDLEDGEDRKIGTGFQDPKEQDLGDLAPIHKKIGAIGGIVETVGNRLNDPDRPFNLTGVHKLVGHLKDWASKPVERQPGKSQD